MQLFGDKRHLDTDERFLIEQSIKGNRSAQKRIFDTLSGKMMAVCLRYMGDRDSAEDVLQNGFVTLFTKLDTYSGEGSFEGWARKIFVNTALMALRRKDALRQSEDVEAASDLSYGGVTPVQNMSYDELMKLVTSLPPGFRTVFNMYVVEGYSHREIAESLGISENTSRSQLQRARTMLQNKIKELYQDV
ncbi:MAG: RNA polymerase sigma factor [Bacteroidales bacterium]|nr:RNA polymerase sigma factor [Bacteroidales bacterium]